MLHRIRANEPSKSPGIKIDNTKEKDVRLFCCFKEAKLIIYKLEKTCFIYSLIVVIVIDLFLFSLLLLLNHYTACYIFYIQIRAIHCVFLIWYFKTTDNSSDK